MASSPPSLERVTLTINPSRQRAGREGPDPAYLIVLDGSTSSLFPLPPVGDVVIGRAPDAGLRLKDLVASRTHAKLVIQGDTIQIVDLRSHNGTLVNGERIASSCVLSSGDVISISNTTLILHRNAPLRSQRAICDLETLRQRVEEELDRAAQFQRRLALLCISFGRPVLGEPQVISALANKTRLFDVVGWGGATQMIMVMPEGEDEEVLETGREVINAVAKVTPRVCIGFARYPDDGTDVETLMGSARAAARAAQPGTVVAAGDTSTTLEVGDRQIVVADPAMTKLFNLLERLAESDLPVLINGETGAGKDIAAAALHYWSSRREQRMVMLNCAALPESLVESELFGHEKGAFSGATSAKVGLLEAANGGTVFLDELGELSLSIQAKLLRVLESKRLTRVGDVRERAIDIRLVAATNRNLEQEVLAGRFRQDLLFRLSAARVVLPPLRDRPRELPILARLFLREACARLRREPISLSEAAMQRLLGHAFPGNVRELRNVADYLAATVPGAIAEPSHLPDSITGQVAGPTTSQDPPAAQGRKWRPLDEEIHELERQRMAEALEACGGNQTRAAMLISMPLRTFAGKVKQYDLLPGGSPLRKQVLAD